MMGMPKMRRQWTWIAMLWMAVCTSQAETKVIRNFTLINGTGQPPLPKTAMAVVGARIDWVGPAVALKVPAGAFVAGWSGEFVKPGVDDERGGERKMPFELWKAIIEREPANHLKVAAHIFYLDDAKALVNAGMDGLAHSVRDKPGDEALIDAMKKRGVYQMTTLTRELSTFVFAQPGAMLDDPYLAPSISPA